MHMVCKLPILAAGLVAKPIFSKVYWYTKGKKESPGLVLLRLKLMFFRTL